MNRSNRRDITVAVDALSPAAGSVVADIGFGGGLGIGLLLDRVGTAGRVHGIEISTAMLNRAARRFRREATDGRLALHAGSLTDLPLPRATASSASPIPIGCATTSSSSDVPNEFRERRDAAARCP